MKKRFDELEPGQKKRVIWAVIAIILFTMVMAGYNLRSQRTVPLEGTRNAKTVEIEPNLIEKTMLREQRREIDDLKTELVKLKRENASVKTSQTEAPQITRASATMPEKQVSLAQPSMKIPSADEISQEAITPDQVARTTEKPKWPMPMGEVIPVNHVPRVPSPSATVPQPEPEIVGEISVVSNPEAKVVVDTKSDGRIVYLPPSFMEANLLTGFDASTSGKGKGDPEPMLLRIQTPAVLPNDVKGNVEGCFVVAEAIGRLDKERADVRLVSLSCLSKNGEAVIDEPVKGFVTDSDSKVGLSGRVVSRMGAATARAVIAGLFGGAGDYLKQASTTTSVSALGSTKTVDSGDIASYSIGGGLAEGADTLKEFYVDLVKQTTPVIEVGAAKKITVVISEGKELAIREIDSGTI